MLEGPLGRAALSPKTYATWDKSRQENRIGSHGTRAWRIGRGAAVRLVSDGPEMGPGVAPEVTPQHVQE